MRGEEGRTVTTKKQQKKKEYSVWGKEGKKKSRTCYVKCAYMLSPLNNKYPKGKAHMEAKKK